jgi:hypothetical protein
LKSRPRHGFAPKLVVQELVLQQLTENMTIEQKPFYRETMLEDA